MLHIVYNKVYTVYTHHCLLLNTRGVIGTLGCIICVTQLSRNRLRSYVLGHTPQHRPVVYVHSTICNIPTHMHHTSRCVINICNHMPTRHISHTTGLVSQQYQATMWYVCYTYGIAGLHITRPLTPCYDTGVYHITTQPTHTPHHIINSNHHPQYSGWVACIVDTVL